LLKPTTIYFLNRFVISDFRFETSISGNQQFAKDEDAISVFFLH